MTDSQGFVSFHDKDLMGRRVFFEFWSHGYEGVGPEGLGGVSLDVVAGGTATIALDRLPTQIAERLYRVTGAGIYNESALANRPVPIARALENGKVMGQDSVQSTVYDGRIFWFWGDTIRPDRGLGLFRAAGATSELPASGGLDPDLGVDLDYFVDAQGFAKAMAPESTVPSPPGTGAASLVWLIGLTTATEASGRERLYAVYNIGGFATLEQGIARFDDAAEVFEKAYIFPTSAAARPKSHSYRLNHEGVEYIYFHNQVRMPATEDALLDVARYEVFTALAEGSSTELERGEDGGILYSWKAGTPAISQELIDEGLPVERAERLFEHVVELDTGRPVLVHPNGSTAWNEHRQRFVRMILEFFGQTSLVGEIWFAEADTPVGPWVYARKIVTHDSYSFYNPRHHPYFDERGGRDLFFEATYSNAFSLSSRTPRYDYNQVMYKLDLDDERLRLPVPVYDQAPGGRPGGFVTKAGLRPGSADPPAPFMALDRPTSGSVPVYWSGAACAPRVLLTGGPPRTEPVFYALPPDAQSLSTTTLPLYEYFDKSIGRAAYSVDGAWVVEPRLVRGGWSRHGLLRARHRGARATGVPAFERSADPLVHVWRNPLAVDLPVTDYLGDFFAEAGRDRCVQERRPGHGARVTLDASVSGGTETSIRSYLWVYPDVDGGLAVASGPTHEISLRGGVNLATLVVTDEEGRKRSDSVVINVGSTRDCDLDGVADAADNCGVVPNRDQRDTNGDGLGNACDMDYDDDGFVGRRDLVALWNSLGKTDTDPDFDPDVDCDGDGRIGGSDFRCIFRNFGRPPGPDGLHIPERARKQCRHVGRR